MIKFLPSYVGSKSRWISELEEFRGKDFVEIFCGSSVISSNLARTSILNDLDPMIFNIMSRFDELIVPDVFTKEDYFKFRSSSNWWKYSFCFQKMSFSGVFRYSKNGYNVPIKSGVESISVREDYELSLERWKNLNPLVTNKDFSEFPLSFCKDKVVVLDPPYETSQASYNGKFDYELYWNFVQRVGEVASEIILFDKVENMPFREKCKLRSMRVNGKYKGSEEAIHIFRKSLKVGQSGEELFLSLCKIPMIRLDGFKADFRILKSGRTIELKTDSYDCDRTKNFFIERFSDSVKLTPGGPWQSLGKGIDYFIYFFSKNKKFWQFETKELVNRLDRIIQNKELIEIKNEEYTTKGYKIPRSEVEDLAINL